MIEPFEKWAIDFVGPINPTSLNKKNILVCMDFVTKLVEAKVVSFATGKFVVKFLFNEFFPVYHLIWRVSHAISPSG